MILESLKKIQNEKGISLVELVVAVSIFSLVMLAATGIFINAMKAQKAIITMQNVANNTRYVMEFMAKEIRMAQVDVSNLDQTFNDGAGSKLNDSNSPSSDISFISFGGDKIKYSFSGGKVLRSNITSASAADDDQPISSDEFLITDLNFNLNDWDLTVGPSAAAPFVTIFIRAKFKSGVGKEIDMQTSVSPRTY